MPWEITDQYIRSGHRSPEEFEEKSLRTITLSEDEGIKAVVGKLKGKETMSVQSYWFEISKGWTLEKAKEWFEKHYENVRGSLSFKVLEKIVDKPLRIRGIALRAGMSRNFNIYTPEELQAFAEKLVSAPVYNFNNIITTEEMGSEYKYHVIPEFSPQIILPLLITATLITILITKRKPVYRPKFSKTPKTAKRTFYVNCHSGC